MENSKIQELLESLKLNEGCLLSRKHVESIAGKRARLDINVLIKRGYIINKIHGRKNKIEFYKYMGYQKPGLADKRFTKRYVIRGNIEEVILPEVVKPVGSLKKFWNYLFKRD